jgi:hypothetical protein
MGARKMYQNIRLCLGDLIASRMPTGIRYTCIRIFLLLNDVRMRLGHVLEIGRFLDELLVRAMRTDKLKILNVLCLHMIIHCILFLSYLVAVFALKLTGVRFGIVRIRHLLEGRERGREEKGLLGVRVWIATSARVQFFANPPNFWI